MQPEVASSLPRVALVVEDDELLRRSLAQLLEDEGFEVMTATTLERARYILFQSTHPVGVVLLDLALADGPGESLVEELNELERSPAVVVTSAHAARAVPLAANYGIPHVAKPFELDVVIATTTVAWEHGLRPHQRGGSGSTMRRRRIG